MSRKPSTNESLTMSQARATWVASVVAAIALIVSVFSLYESRQARMATTRDEIVVRLQRLRGGNSLTVVRRPSALKPGAVVAPWSVLISNTGSSTLSITSYEINQVKSDNAIAMYSGLDSGLRQGDTLEAAPLPLSLESGKSVRLTLNIGLNPGVRAYEALLSTLHGASATVPIGKAEHLLASQSIDIYDNPVLPLMADGKIAGWSVNDTSREQIFLFKIRTARGVESGDLAFWYERERY